MSFGNVTVASAAVHLCDWKTHTVNVTVAGNSTILEVDGQLGLTESVEPLDLSLSYSTFIGGLPGWYILQYSHPVNYMCIKTKCTEYTLGFPSTDVSLASTLVSAFYTGCMDVTVNGHLLDMDEAQHKHNDVRSHACPLVGPHQ